MSGRPGIPRPCCLPQRQPSATAGVHVQGGRTQHNVHMAAWSRAKSGEDNIRVVGDHEPRRCCGRLGGVCMKGEVGLVCPEARLSAR
jgi:hypothetical protein